MKVKLLIIIFLSLGIIIMACGFYTEDNTMAVSDKIQVVQDKTEEVARYMIIKPEEAKKLIDKGEGLIILDVRTQEEYNEKHIPKSILIPVEELEKEAPTKLQDKNATIIVYCRSGNRSAVAVQVLDKMGYKKVYDLGGIIDWPYETESSN